MAESSKVSHKKGLGPMAERKQGWEGGKGSEEGELKGLRQAAPQRRLGGQLASPWL